MDPACWRRYDVPIDLDSPIDSRAIVLRLVPAGARVLELGCSAGLMTEVLNRRDHQVVGVEIDPEPAAQAAPFTEHGDSVLIGDLDGDEVFSALAALDDPRFEVILAADVLEHLRDPTRALRRVVEHLRPGGRVILSIPNVAHGDIRLRLLAGIFEYRDSGLMDRTHIHLFTYDALLTAIAESGLVVTGWHRCVRPMGETELEVAPQLVDFGRRVFAEDPEADTYQWILECARIGDADPVPDPHRLGIESEPGSAGATVVAAVAGLIARAEAPPPPPPSLIGEARRVAAGVRRRIRRR